MPSALDCTDAVVVAYARVQQAGNAAVLATVLFPEVGSIIPAEAPVLLVVLQARVMDCK
jgi:hypothetical protein